MAPVRQLWPHTAVVLCLVRIRTKYPLSNCQIPFSQSHKHRCNKSR